MFFRFFIIICFFFTFISGRNEDLSKHSPRRSLSLNNQIPHLPSKLCQEILNETFGAIVGWVSPLLSSSSSSSSSPSSSSASSSSSSYSAHQRVEVVKNRSHLVPGKKLQHVCLSVIFKRLKLTRNSKEANNVCSKFVNTIARHKMNKTIFISLNQAKKRWCKIPTSSSFVANLKENGKEEKEEEGEARVEKNSKKNALMKKPEHRPSVRDMLSLRKRLLAESSTKTMLHGGEEKREESGDKININISPNVTEGKDIILFSSKEDSNKVLDRWPTSDFQHFFTNFKQITNGVKNQLQNAIDFICDGQCSEKRFRRIGVKDEREVYR